VPGHDELWHLIVATKLEHLEQSIPALEIELSEEEITLLEDAYQPHPVLGHT
jgi:aryl-alcohol dehydrogenase-like predicted oxidoreductase